MILLIIRMKVLAEKRKELSQTISSLMGSIRREKGCRRCEFCQSMEDENGLSFLEEWDTREDLNSHLNSEGFRVLRGAMNLLQEPCEMVFHTVAARRKRTKGRSHGSLMTGMTGAKVPTVKPNSERRNTMEPSTKDQAEGVFHQIKGKIKEVAGKLGDNPELEAEGKDEKRAGKVQKKVGQVEKVLKK